MAWGRRASIPVGRACGERGRDGGIEHAIVRDVNFRVVHPSSPEKRPGIVIPAPPRDSSSSAAAICYFRPLKFGAVHVSEKVPTSKISI